jgi:hypothetical protein
MAHRLWHATLLDKYVEAKIRFDLKSVVEYSVKSSRTASVDPLPLPSSS